jgi:hypothetical protein
VLGRTAPIASDAFDPQETSAVHCGNSFELHRVIEWVDFGPIFESPGCFCCCRCGHVGNALALSIMSTAVPLVWT